MLEAIKRFFDSQIFIPSDSGTRTIDESLQLASAALLVEVMRADDRFEQVENDTLLELLSESFSLSAEKAAELVSLARQEVEQATDCYQFTSLINKNFELPQRVEMVELLWKMAFADGRLDPYEEHIVRKVSELLHVPHREFIAAKHRADTRRG
ncbi:MAG: tellurite resistance TerB family protein [Gammaproteobacteria bacterium]